MDLKAQSFEDVVILSPAGRIDHNSAEAFQQSLMQELEACGRNGANMTLNLSDVEYMSSVGLRALMIAAKQAKKIDTVIAVAAMKSDMQEIFEISRFNLVFPTYDTVAGALQKLSASAAEAYTAATG